MKTLIKIYKFFGIEKCLPGNSNILLKNVKTCFPIKKEKTLFHRMNIKYYSSPIGNTRVRREFPI